jgi:hypothetical protein
MAQTRKRRRRKHRGTQTGRIDNRGPRGRPRTREEARARAKGKRRTGGKGKVVDRRDLPPTWGGAVKRGLIAAGVLFLLAITLLGYELGPAAGLTALMLAMYIPLGYYIDRAMYRRRMRQQQAARAAKKQGG